MLKALIFTIVFYGSCNVLASPLVNRYQFLSTDVLPKGVWAYGVNYGQGLGHSSESYNNSGRLVKNQSNLSESLSFGNLVSSTKDPVEKELARAAFTVYDKSLNSNAGVVENNLEVSESARTFILGRGISERSNLFLIVPIVTINSNFTSSFTRSKELNQLLSELREEGQYIQAQTIEDNTDNAFFKSLSDNNYRTEIPSQITTVANIFLNYRYKVLENRKFNILTDSFFILPSGRSFDENDFMDLRINEEQYSFKQGLALSSHLFSNKIQTLFGAYYHKRFPFRKTKRIPTTAINPLSSDKENLDVKYGDAYGLSAQLGFNLNDNLLYMGSSFEKRFADSYRGNNFSNDRYQILERGTEQELSINYIGASFNTINKFLKNEFFLPMDLNIQYGQTVAGKNSFYIEQFTVNLIGFYK